MKYIIVFLFLCASIAFGAVPSFQAFDANFFQITGTGNNSIKIKTNNFTWGGISGGSGDSVWTNSLGTIKPTGIGLNTNAVLFGPDGTVGVGRTSPFPLSEIYVFRALRDTSLGEYAETGVSLESQDSPTADIYSSVLMKAKATPEDPQSYLYMDTTANGYDNYTDFNVALTPTTARVKMENENGLLTDFNPTAANGTTPYTFDTSVLHEDSSGSIVSFSNKGTNIAKMNINGGWQIGRKITPVWGTDDRDVLVAWHAVDAGEPDRSYLFIGSGQEANLTADHSFLEADTFANGNATLKLNNRVSGITQSAYLNLSAGGAKFELALPSVVTRLEPTAADGETPYILDTSLTHTSGNLLEVKNNGTNKFVVAWDGTIAEATFGSATFSNVYFLASVIASNGVASYRSNKLAVASITIGASPVNWTNTSGANVNVLVDGVGVTGTVGINGTTIWNTIGQNTVPLQHGEWTTITYTVGTPTAFWKPL